MANDGVAGSNSIDRGKGLACYWAATTSSRIHFVPADSSSDSVTLLLRDALQGDQRAEEELVRLVYGELRERARVLLAREENDSIQHSSRKKMRPRP